MPCKHAELMIIYAKQAAEMDEPWKFCGSGDRQKVDGIDLAVISHSRIIGNTAKIPKTININGHEVPDPMREKPKCDSYYWCIDPDRKNGVSKHVWEDDSADNCRLSKGLCHLTSENCIAHARALFSFSEIKE